MHSSVDEIVEDGKKNDRYEAHEEEVSNLEIMKKKFIKKLTISSPWHNKLNM